jgi:proteasome lid subunit RPN8/RPN11
MSFDDMDKLDLADTIGTFHTHPNASANLSHEDYESFMGYPRLVHYIVGADGVRKFRVMDGILIQEENQ